MRLCVHIILEVTLCIGSDKSEIKPNQSVWVEHFFGSSKNQIKLMKLEVN